MAVQASDRDDGVPIHAVGNTKIVTRFGHYDPPFDVSLRVLKMTSSIPSQYITGLSEIVLTDAGSLSRSRRRSVTKARKRKVRIAAVRGLYHPAWQGNTARIEIFVDNALSGWSKRWWMRLPFLRDLMLSDVLFHEIGHHIHATQRREYREKEDVADEWKYRLGRQFIDTECRWLWPCFACLKLFRRPIEQAARKAGLDVR